MSLYTASGWILAIHNWRRPNAADAMRLASNTFNPDWNSAAGRSYRKSQQVSYPSYSPAATLNLSVRAAPAHAVEGILSLSGAYFAIGILGFILFVALNLSGICCGGGAIARSKLPYTGCVGWLLSPTLWFIGGVIVMCCGTSAALAQVTAFQKTVRFALPPLMFPLGSARLAREPACECHMQVTETASGINGFTGLLNTASQQVSNGVAGSLASLNNTLVTLEAAAAAIPVAPADLATISDMISSTTASAASTTSVSSLLNSTVSSLNRQLGNGGNVDVTSIGNRVYLGGAVSLGIFLIGLVIGAVFVLPRKSCASMFRYCNALLVVAFVLVYIFTGLFMAVSVAGSDICVAPSASIGSVVSLTAGTAADTILYYSSCQTAPGVVTPPTAGALFDLLAGQASLNATRQTYDSTQAALVLAYPALAADAAAVGPALTATSAALAAVVSTVGCLPVNNVYQGLVQTLCGTGIPSVINVWGLGTAACLLMLILTISGVRLCFRHPGDVVADPTDPRFASVGFGTAPSYAPLASGAPSSYGSSSGVPDWGKRPLPSKRR